MLDLTNAVPVEKWGIRPAPPDPRDYPYSLKVAQPVATPDRPRRYINHRLTVRYQGDYGTCGGQAAADSKDLREGVVTSSLYAYRMAKSIDGRNEEGTDIRSIMKALQQNGICREELYPYSGYQGNLQFPELSQEALNDAANRKIEGYARCATVDEVMDAIYKYDSVLCGILVAENFYTPHQGFVPIPSGAIRGGHAVDLIGYDMDLSHTYPDGKTYQGFFYLSNSWGEGWGDKGNGWIPFEFLFPSVPTPGVQNSWDFFAPIDQFPVRTEEKVMDVAPFMSNERTFVPVRFMAEALGAQVEWVENTQTIRITLGETVVEMKIGHKEYTITKKGV